jgi:helicase
MAFLGLFVGIDRYASPADSRLTCARRDATALHAPAADTFGVSGTLLTDGQATRSAIEREFAALAACDRDDVVFMLFSGHGMPTHELVTYNADVADLPDTCVPLSALTEWFSRIPARRLVCVLDCCFSGGMGAKVLVSDLVPRDQTSPEATLSVLSGAGRLILTASLATEPAWEITPAGHGLLTSHLLAALQGADEVRQAGKVPVYRLLHYVTKQVTDAAATFGKKQHPAMRGQMDWELA